MVVEERSIKVDLQVRINENHRRTLRFDGSVAYNRDPSLRFLRNHIRDRTYPVFEGSAMTIKLGGQVLRGPPNATLTELGVPWEGSTLVISKVLLF